MWRTLRKAYTLNKWVKMIGNDGGEINVKCNFGRQEEG